MSTGHVASPMPDQRVAFLGTGLMGAPMAARLLAAGYRLSVWNRTPEKAESLRALGATICRSPAEAAAEARFICTCLTDAAAVEAVAFAALAEGAAPGAIIIDFSTIGVDPARRFSERLWRDHGLAWLDCPVSGGVKGARDGSLIVLAGGDAAALAEAAGLLGQLAQRVTRLGAAGAGQATKLCNQLIVASTLVAVAEAVALGDALGVDTGQLAEALRGGFADSQPLQLFGPRMAAASDPGPRVAEIRTMAKDVTMVADAAGAVEAALPLIETVASRYDAAVQAGLGRDDLPALMQLYRVVERTRLGD